MLLVILYNNQATKRILIEQAMESEAAELSLIKDAMSENIRDISDVSRRLYFDKMIEKIAFTQYKDYEDLLEDYYNYTRITECLDEYYQDISSIKVYLNNKTIANTSTFIYAEPKMQKEDWYQKTLKEKGNVYWSYALDSLTKKNCLRLSRVLYTKDMKQVGVLAIFMQNKRTQLPVSNRRNKTVLLYNNEEIVHSNFEAKDSQIIDIVRGHNKDVYYGKVVFEKQECFLVTVKVKPEYSDNYYTLACIGPYKEIVKDVNETTMKECLPFIVCIAIAGCLIAVFSTHFSRQINQFRETMHEAASGNFNTVRHLGGKDELSMLYEDLNVMIEDIQHLMDEVVAEQVQKEKLNSRQKEVEFKMLASQINPHFLYNTLETIRMKAIVNKQSEIAELAKMLAKIMRRNIQVGEKLVTLESEIQLVEYYLKIQNYRFGDRIQSEIIIDEMVDMESYIMPLMIQPLVENAFVHGLEAVEMEGKLTIHVSSDKDITIVVADNGVGIAPDKLVEINTMLNDFDTLDRTHIGICNVNQRIKLQYGDIYGLTISSREGEGTEVVLKMPIVKTDC